MCYVDALDSRRRASLGEFLPACTIRLHWSDRQSHAVAYRIIMLIAAIDAISDLPLTSQDRLNVSITFRSRFAMLHAT